MTEHRVDSLAAIDTTTFRSAMGLFPTGVAIIASGVGDELEVVTANSLTSISLDPPLLLISIRADGKIRSKIDQVGAFSVSILSAKQESLSVNFARKDRPAGRAAMQHLGAALGVANSILLPGSLVSLECTLETQYAGGDHILFLGRVVMIHPGDPEDMPLVTHRSNYMSISLPRPEQYLG